MGELEDHIGLNSALLASDLSHIVKKGAEALMAETTWMFKCDTSKGYEEWCKQKIKPESLPEYITLEAYKGALKHELTALYNKEKAEHEVQQ